MTAAPPNVAMPCISPPRSAPLPACDTNGAVATCTPSESSSGIGAGTVASDLCAGERRLSVDLELLLGGDGLRQHVGEGLLCAEAPLLQLATELRTPTENLGEDAELALIVLALGEDRVEVRGRRATEAISIAGGEQTHEAAGLLRELAVLVDLRQEAPVHLSGLQQPREDLGATEDEVVGVQPQLATTHPVLLIAAPGEAREERFDLLGAHAFQGGRAEVPAADLPEVRNAFATAHELPQNRLRDAAPPSAAEAEGAQLV